MKRFRRVEKIIFPKYQEITSEITYQKFEMDTYKPKLCVTLAPLKKTSMPNGECFPNIHKIASLQKLPI